MLEVDIVIAVVIHRKGRDERKKHKRQHISFKPLSGVANSPYTSKRIMIIKSSKIVFSILSLLFKNIFLNVKLIYSL